VNAGWTLRALDAESAPPSSGAPEAERETGETLSIPRSGGKTLAAYLALPKDRRPAPGVVIIHEITGLDQHARRVAHRFADSSYVALAVDLFSTGSRATCLIRIFHGILVRPITNGVVGDLRSAIDVLAARPEVDGSRLGVIGFCMGGSYALQLACVEGRLKSASVFYGQNPRPLEAVAHACPIVGSYPERDFTARQARSLEAALTRHAVPHEIKIYPEAKHSFFNDTRRAHDPEAATDSWARTLRFFEQHLRRRE
jgi:carboxymethylenebutenolidase